MSSTDPDPQQDPSAKADIDLVRRSLATLRDTLREVTAQAPTDSHSAQRAQIKILESSAPITAIVRESFPAGFFAQREYKQRGHEAAVFRAWMELFNSLNDHPHNRYHPERGEVGLAHGFSIVCRSMLGLAPVLADIAIHAIRMRPANSDRSAGAVMPVQE